MTDYTENYKALLNMCELETAIDVIMHRASEITDEQLSKLEFALWVEGAERRSLKDYNDATTKKSLVVQMEEA